jgi:hypothetical protein
VSTLDQSDSSRRPGRWRAYSVSTKSFGKAAAIPPAVQCRTDTGPVSGGWRPGGASRAVRDFRRDLRQSGIRGQVEALDARS